MRLAKYLASAGVSSRRAAEELIRSGRVSVGGGGGHRSRPRRRPPPTPSTVDGEPVEIASERWSSTQSTSRSASSQQPATPRAVPPSSRSCQRHCACTRSGRLDIDTTGLILLTNDGDLAHRLTHPRFEVDKELSGCPSLNPPVRDSALRALRAGVRLDDGWTAPARVRRARPDTLELTIHEGRKRQVKRMCEHVGHPVKRLERIRFGPLELGGLRLGSYRRTRGGGG